MRRHFRANPVSIGAVRHAEHGGIGRRDAEAAGLGSGGPAGGGDGRLIQGEGRDLVLRDDGVEVDQVPDLLWPAGGGAADGMATEAVADKDDVSHSACVEHAGHVVHEGVEGDVRPQLVATVG